MMLPISSNFPFFGQSVMQPPAMLVAARSTSKELLEAADAAPEQDNLTQQNKVFKTTEEQDAKHKTQEFQSASPPNLADDRALVGLRRERGRERTRTPSTSKLHGADFLAACAAKEDQGFLAT